MRKNRPMKKANICFLLVATLAAEVFAEQDVAEVSFSVIKRIERDLGQADGAVTQEAMARNKTKNHMPIWKEISVYIKPGSPILEGMHLDPVGHPYELRPRPDCAKVHPKTTAVILAFCRRKYAEFAKERKKTPAVAWNEEENARDAAALRAKAQKTLDTLQRAAASSSSGGIPATTSRSSSRSDL